MPRSAVRSPTAGTVPPFIARPTTLVWQDAEGRTWVGYNDPGWIAVRHGIADAPETIAAMRAALAAVVSEATKDEHPK